MYRPTKMLCTKIHIYDQFPVEWDAYLPKSMCRSAWKLSLKILLCRTVVNYLVKLKLKLGTVRSYPTTFLWPYSFYLWNLAPENAHGAQHFKSCCFLGQPRARSHQTCKHLDCLLDTPSTWFSVSFSTTQIS